MLRGVIPGTEDPDTVRRYIVNTVGASDSVRRAAECGPQRP